LQQNNLEAQALKIVTEAVEKLPDEFGLWNLLEGMSSATSEQRAQAKSEMKRLDPNNPNLR
jgi:N-methylhydantoinase B/oxoprolinase/acetone carboxylase alpha subunit